MLALLERGHSDGDDVDEECADASGATESRAECSIVTSGEEDTDEAAEAEVDEEEEEEEEEDAKGLVEKVYD